jgi:hypothetical protein
MKKYKDQNLELDIAISKLEAEKELLLKELKQQANITYQSIKPSNIIKQTVLELKEADEFKGNLKDITLGIVGGYFTKKLVVGKSDSLFKKILGSTIQYAMTAFISRK